MARRGPTGRPPVYKGKMRLNLYLSAAEYAALQSASARSGVPKTQLVRRALLSAMKMPPVHAED